MISYFPEATSGEVPLEAATWQMLLAELTDDLAASAEAEQVARLREGYVLLARAPGGSIAPLPLPETFAAWLAAGACETAALALLGGVAGYMVSRGGEGRHLATVVLANGGAEHSAEGATLVLALLGALAEALLARSEAVRALGHTVAGRVLH